MCKSWVVSLQCICVWCIWVAVYVQRLCHVFAVYVIAMHVHRSDKAKNRLIYCIMQTCKCAKAESCLCNICVYVVYELNMWIKRCYCSVCDCAACKSTWKCEKLIDLLHHICLYVCKRSITRFIYTRCWLWIFCKLCLSEELNNLININRAVTALYSCVELTHSWKARQ